MKCPLCPVRFEVFADLEAHVLSGMCNGVGSRDLEGPGHDSRKNVGGAAAPPRSLLDAPETARAPGLTSSTTSPARTSAGITSSSSRNMTLLSEILGERTLEAMTREPRGNSDPLAPTFLPAVGCERSPSSAQTQTTHTSSAASSRPTLADWRSRLGLADMHDTAKEDRGDERRDDERENERGERWEPKEQPGRRDDLESLRGVLADRDGSSDLLSRYDSSKQQPRHFSAERPVRDVELTDHSTHRERFDLRAHRSDSQPSVLELRAENARLQAKVENLMEEQSKAVEENSRLHVELSENQRLSESSSKYESLQEHLQKTKDTLRQLQQDVRRLSHSRATDASHTNLSGITAPHHSSALSASVFAPALQSTTNGDDSLTLRHQLKDMQETLMSQQETSHRLVQQLENTIAQQYQLASKNSAERTAEILRLQRELTLLREDNERMRLARLAPTQAQRPRSRTMDEGNKAQSNSLLQTKLRDKEVEFSRLADELLSARKAHLHAERETENDIMRRLTSGKVSRDHAAQLEVRLKRTRQAVASLEAQIASHGQKFGESAPPQSRLISAAPEGQQSRSAKKKPWK